MNRVDIEKMIRSIVRRLRLEYGGTEWDDLEAEGWAIVTEKIDGYRKNRGASLSTYLYTQVEGHMRNYIERNVLKHYHLNGHRQHIASGIVPELGQEDSTEDKILLKQMVSLETGIHRDVLICMIGGLSQQGTADELKVSKQRVAKILKDIRSKYGREANVIPQD